MMMYPGQWADISNGTVHKNAIDNSHEHGMIENSGWPAQPTLSTIWKKRTAGKMFTTKRTIVKTVQKQSVF